MLSQSGSENEDNSTRDDDVEGKNNRRGTACNHPTAVVFFSFYNFSFFGSKLLNERESLGHGLSVEGRAHSSSSVAPAIWPRGMTYFLYSCSETYPLFRIQTGSAISFYSMTLAIFAFIN